MTLVVLHLLLVLASLEPHVLSGILQHAVLCPPPDLLVCVGVARIQTLHRDLCAHSVHTSTCVSAVASAAGGEHNLSSMWEAYDAYSESHPSVAAYQKMLLLDTTALVCCGFPCSCIQILP